LTLSPPQFGEVSKFGGGERRRATRAFLVVPMSLASFSFHIGYWLLV
jgi:hypothetical protein